MPNFTEDGLVNLINNGESSTLELKVAPPRQTELAQRICGLTNALGGYVVIGVKDDNLEVVGLKNTKDTIDTLLGAARQCQPPVAFAPSEPEIYNLKGRKVVVANVPRTRGPLYQVSGVCWMRRGTETSPLSVAEIVEILNDRGQIKWELQPARKATLKDLDESRIRKFLEYRSGRSRTANRFTELGEVLVGMDCAIVTGTGEIRPTNAGLLFFGFDPQLSIPQSEAVCVFYGDEYGVGGYLDRKIIRGTLLEIIDGIEAFISNNIRIGARIEGWKRVDLPEYPLEALREAVINAAVHRDYSRDGESIRVFIYSDRIEIHNPGLLLPGITVEQLRRGEVASKLRNPVLANLLRDVPGYMERIGSGVRLMLRETERLGLPQPEFRELGEFIVTFRHSLLESNKPIQTSSAGATSSVAITKLQEPPTTVDENKVIKEAKGSEEVSKTLIDQSRRLIMAMQYVKEYGSITNHDYRELTGASENTATRDLDFLVERGALRGIGKTRGRRYTLP